MKEYVQAEVGELKARCERLEVELAALKATVEMLSRRTAGLLPAR